MRPARLHLEHLVDRRVRATVTGELDGSVAEHVWAELQDANGHELELDLRPVHFVDSGGLHLLADIDEHWRAEGLHVAFVVDNATVLRALDAVGFLDRFDVRRTTTG